jgi:hypothetical protein
VRRTLLAAVALALAGPVGAPAGAVAGDAVTAPDGASARRGGSGAGRSPEEAALAEVRAFYRDLAAEDWPAKVIARWRPPEGAPAPPLACGDLPRVDLVGEWARVAVAREGRAELFWLLDLGDGWRIVRLARADLTPSCSPAPPA